jgi:hypothetical protein
MQVVVGSQLIMLDTMLDVTQRATQSKGGNW